MIEPGTTRVKPRPVPQKGLRFYIADTGIAGQRRAGPAVIPDPRGARGYCTTDHTKVAVPETPSVSFAVTVTV